MGASWGGGGGATLTQTLKVARRQLEGGSQIQCQDEPSAPSILAMRNEVARHLQDSWRSTPRLSGAGAGGDRFEHFWPMGLLPDKGASTSMVIAQLLVGQAPPLALDLFRTGRLTGIPKKTGGTRVLAAGRAARRLAAKAACRLHQHAITQAVGAHQFGVGISAGTEMLRLLS